MTPLVSVVIPTYNSAKFIGETIESVFNQSYQNIEIIIVNDGSNDETGQVIKCFMQKGKVVNYIFQENAGVSGARNTGFLNSRGDYIAFLDADDILLPTNIEAKVNKLLEDNLLGLVHSDMAFIDTFSNRTGEKNQGIDGYVLDQLLLWERCVIPAPSSILIKRSVCLDVGLFSTDLSTAADQEFFFRVAAKYKIGRISECLGLYRVHGSNMSKNIPLLEHDHILAYQKAASNKLFKSVWFKKRCFSNMYLILSACWWGDGNNKLKGIKFLLVALFIYPLNLTKIFSKLKNVR